MKTRSNKTPAQPEIEPQQLEEKVRLRAHQLYEERGRQDGHDLDDWLLAEEEIHYKKPRSVAA